MSKAIIVQGLFVFGMLSLSACPKKTTRPGSDLDGLECEVGQQNCVCQDGDLCNAGLTCLNDLCIACNQDKIGCPCEDQCESPLVCNVETMVCEDASVCLVAECLLHQFCETPEGENEIACVNNRCEPGFEWNAQTETCTSIQGSHCEGEGELAIADECMQLNRTCIQSESLGARCGNCLDESIPTESHCAQSEATEACVELGCANNNRACIQIDVDEYVCGECLEGFERNENDECQPTQAMGCGLCDLQNRDCVEVDGMNQCEACFEGFVENAQGQCVEKIDCPEGQLQDLQTNECRPARVCGDDVVCDENEICTQASGQDAQCSEGCPEDWAIDIVTGACRPCATIVPQCEGIEGATGRAILSDSADNATCICEPADEYYPGSQATRPVKCDEDGDGWVSDSALRFMEEDNPVSRILRQNCHLRKIHEVVLRNEKGEELTVAFGEERQADERILMGGGVLPLYETEKNDVLEPIGDDFHRPYGDVDIESRVLNSLTKACVGKTDDYNDNSISDVEESVTSEIQGRLSGPGFLRYYEVYLRFSYFMELYDSWYEEEPGEGDEVIGRLVIEERSRLEQAEDTVPLQYPSEPFPSNGAELWYSFPEGANHVGETWAMPIAQWRVCDRKPDAFYIQDEPPESRAGGDFTEPLFAPRNLELVGDNRWSGLNHHSQFKCVLYESLAQYDTEQANQSSHPHMVFQNNANDPLLYQKEAVTERQIDHRWTLNRCRAKNEIRQEVGAGQRNTAFQGVECELVDMNPDQGEAQQGAGGNNDAEMAERPGPEASTVYWAAVGYQNYSEERAEGNNAPEYERGCINECDEWGVEACPVPPELGFEPAEPRFTCDDENEYIFGKLQCGCGYNYGGGALCDIGCPDMEMRHNATFNIETREGIWMCGKLTGSQGPVSEGGDFSLKGAVSVSGTDGRAMQSSDGQFVLRGR